MHKRSVSHHKVSLEHCQPGLALEIDPHYVKALQRRAAANDRLSTWSSLTTAQEGAFFHDLLRSLLSRSGIASPSFPERL